MDHGMDYGRPSPIKPVLKHIAYSTWQEVLDRCGKAEEFNQWGATANLKDVLTELGRQEEMQTELNAFLETEKKAWEKEKKLIKEKQKTDL